MNILALPSARRHLALGGTYNVRDLGGYPTVAGRQTRWRQVLRADALHRLDAAGRRQLLDAGLRTVVDLRFDHENVAAPAPFAPGDGVEVLRIPLFQKLAMTGTGAPAVAAAGADDLLFAIYAAALSQCGEAIGAVLATIAEAPDGMLLFHCTAGKDRTGIVAALLLLGVGVAAETVEEDYALTATLAQPLFEELVAAARARGEDAAQFARLMPSEPATMRATLALLGERHGGVDAYLAALGIGPAERERLRTRLVEAA